MIGRKECLHAVGPFNKAHTVGIEIFIGAKSQKVGRFPQPVDVEMENGQAAQVLVNKDKRGTGDGPAIDPHRLGNGTHESRLTCPEVTHQRYSCSWFQSLGQSGSQRLRFFNAAGDKSPFSRD